MKELMALLHIKLNVSTPYHPQTDGQTERVNREIGKYLRIFAEKQSDWTDWISAAEFAYNNSLHSATGFTPFWLNKGRHPTGHPSEITTNETMLAANHFATQIQTSCEIAERALEKAKLAMKKNFDKRHQQPIEFELGDLVLVSSNHLPSKRGSKKLDM